MTEGHVAPSPAREWPLADKCALISQFWVNQWGSFQLEVLQRYGGDALASFKKHILRRHQRDYFLPGVEKLGISLDLPPAVVAARYHYFSNMLGNLAMEYVEESPRKVWIRYLAPSYSFTGVSLAAVPSKVQRAMFSGWHPFNGKSLKAPNLRFVVTKVFQDGEPYDEGYFEEIDRPLEDDERVLYRPVSMSPDFDPAKAPTLDATLWPKDRLSKAKRNFSRGFLEDSIRTCFEIYGVNATNDIVAQAMRIFAIQFFAEYKEKLGLEVAKAADLVELFGTLCDLANEAFDVEAGGDGTLRVRRCNRMLAGDAAPAELFRGLGQTIALWAKMASARIKVDLVSLEHGPDGLACEHWEFCDTAERLF